MFIKKLIQQCKRNANITHSIPNKTNEELKIVFEARL